MKKGSYGQELILDLHNCDTTTFTRTSIRKYFDGLCKAINMKKCECYFWDDYGVPTKEKQTQDHTTGISAVQFILTSSIVIHTLSKMKRVYLNIFSCKDFDPKVAKQFSVDWFKGTVKQNHVMDRI